MDVLDFINRNGQRDVPNPNYNPKSKKNTEPATIIVPDVQPVTDDAVELAKRDALNQFSIDSNITDNLKYEEMSKLLAMNTVSDVYGDIKLNIDYNNSKVALLDKFGNIYNPDDIFNRKINENETQYEVYDRLNEIYSMYNELMDELNFYK